VNDRLIVGLSAAIWCVLHSWYVAHGTQRWLARVGGRYYVFNRLVFAIGSTLSVGVLLIYWHNMPAKMLFAWPGWWQVLRWGGLMLAGYLFLRGAQVYDNWAFVGLRQVAGFRSKGTGAASGLIRDGILRNIRHPYYSGAFVFLVFYLPITDINLVWRGVFFVYVYVGTLLEERKLLAEFGEEYRRYQREVPMFFPKLGSKGKVDGGLSSV